MGSSHTKSSNPSGVQLVTVTTESLRERLNRMYDVMRARSRDMSGSGLFDYLWDLKELALIEGKQSVQLPITWLDELEHDYSDVLTDSGRAH